MKGKCLFCGCETDNHDKKCDNCWEVQTRIKIMPMSVLAGIILKSGYKVVELCECETNDHEKEKNE
jgi:hypothetical protein